MCKKLKRKNVLRLLSMMLVVASLVGSPVLAKEVKSKKVSDEVLLEIDIDKKAKKIDKTEPVTYLNTIKRQKYEIEKYIDAYKKNNYFRNNDILIKSEEGKMVTQYKNVTIIRDSILKSSMSYNNEFMEKDRLIPEDIKDLSITAAINVLSNLDLDDDILEGLKIHISPHPFRNSSGFTTQAIKEISIHDMDLIGPEMAKYLSLSSLVSHELWHAIEPFLIEDYKARYGTNLIDDYANHYEKFSNKKYETLLEGEYDRENDIYEAIATDFAIYEGLRIEHLIGSANLEFDRINKDSSLKYNHDVTDFFDKVLYDR